MLVGDAARSDTYHSQNFLFLMGLSAGSAEFLQDALYTCNRGKLAVGSFRHILSAGDSLYKVLELVIARREVLVYPYSQRTHNTGLRWSDKQPPYSRAYPHSLESGMALANFSRWACSKAKRVMSESRKFPNGKGLANAGRQDSRVKMSV